MTNGDMRRIQQEVVNFMKDAKYPVKMRIVLRGLEVTVHDPKTESAITSEFHMYDKAYIKQTLHMAEKDLHFHVKIRTSPLWKTLNGG